MIFRISFISIFLYSFLSACGGGFWPEDYEFNFLHKRHFSFSNIDGDLSYPATYNKIKADARQKTKEINLLEWQKEFGDTYSKKQIEEFLYEKKNLQNIKNEEIFEYIEFLDKQEPFVLSYRESYFKYRYKGKKLKRSDVNLHISEALRKIADVESEYLKLRYFFLALRLSHYYYKPYAITIYKDNKKLLKNTNSIVKDWIDALYAGILFKNGKKVQSVYAFSKLFEEGKTNWYLAFFNFNINTDKEWNELVSLAKTKEDKIKFITLRALNKNANIIEELKNISAINKNSKYFDLLLFKELRASQHFFDIYPNELYFKPEAKNYKPFIEYLKTIKKDEMYTINLALSYFSFYQNKKDEAKKYLQKAYQKVKGDDIHELDALAYILYLDSLEVIDKKTENEIGKRLNDFDKEQCNKQNIIKYSFHKLKDLYKKQGDEFKYFISSNYRYLDINRINLDRYNKIKELKNKKDKTAFEKILEKEIIFKNESFTRNLDRVYAYILLNNLDFEKAFEIYKGNKAKLDFNIFNNLIKGNNRKFVKNKMTLSQSLEKILKIKANLAKNPNLAMDNYLYGTALYNLSYWGNLNSLTTIYRSNYTFKEKELELKKLELSNKHLKLALKHTNKKEFKAKITYMLAKNELALYDIKNSRKYNTSFESGYNFERLYSWGRQFSHIEKYMINGYGKYFDKLKDKYSDTKYYQELISECSNLRQYQDTYEKLENLKLNGKSRKILANLEEEFKYLYENKKRLDKKYELIYFWKLTRQIPISKKTVTRYNNIAYYLQKMRGYKSNEYAKLILEKVLEKYPNRIVAYYNLGDIYWKDYKRAKAKKMYQKYIELMKDAGKENKIPSQVIKRAK